MFVESQDGLRFVNTSYVAEFRIDARSGEVNAVMNNGEKVLMALYLSNDAAKQEVKRIVMGSRIPFTSERLKFKEDLESEDCR